MSDKRASLEVIAATVEEALAKGLSDLGLTEEQVEVEILDEGSRGLFGLRARQARIRLTILSPEVGEVELPAAAQMPAAPPAPIARPMERPTTVETGEEDEIDEPSEVVEVSMQPPRPGAWTTQGERPAAAQLSVEDDIALHVARETVSELLDKMMVKAEVSARFGEAEDARSRIPLLIEVHGKDLSILIGRQAETLNALQYIAGLIIGKELGRSLPVVIDVEGYRQRRSQQLRQLARRMAEQALKTGRRQVLEPMPANERRVIHLELREHPEVATESIGEEPRRKVTIFPK